MTRDNNDACVSKEATFNKEVALRETADSDEIEDQPKVSIFVPFVRHNLLTSPPPVSGTGKDTLKTTHAVIRTMRVHLWVDGDYGFQEDQSPVV